MSGQQASTTFENVSIRYVHINGNERTRNYVIEKELQRAYEARTLGGVISGLEEAMYGLQGLNIFDEIHFEIDDIDDSNGDNNNDSDDNNNNNNNNNMNLFNTENKEALVDLRITVKEKRMIGAKFMVESDGQSSAESTATVTLRNILGSAENGQISAGTDTNLSSIFQANVTWPRFYNLPFSAKLFGSNITNQCWRTSGYNENVKSMGLSFLQHGVDGLSLTFQQDQRDIIPTTLLKSNTTLAATKAIANDCQPTTKASLKLNYTKDTRALGEGDSNTFNGNKFVPLNKSYLINSTLELAGLRNCGDVQFAKASGLFQYWIPLFGSKNTSSSSSAFNWLPMLTFGLSADVVAPFPTSVKNNGQNAKEDRIRINDRIFLNNELMLRGFERRGIGPRAEPISTNP